MLSKDISKWYGVDKLCAIAELRLLGIAISKDYENQIKQSIEELAKLRKHKKNQREKEIDISEENYGNEYLAFIAGYTSGGHPYGLTHEEMKAIDKLSQESKTK